jgi:hypothetical protein
MKIEVKQIEEDERVKKKVSVKKMPVDTTSTLKSATKPPEPVIIKRSFKAEKEYHRALIPRIPTPKIADISLLGRGVILISATALVIIGVQSLLVEYDNKIWNLLLTPFNVAIILLGLILIALYIPKKHTHESIR